MVYYGHNLLWTLYFHKISIEILHDVLIIRKFFLWNMRITWTWFNDDHKRVYKTCLPTSKTLSNRKLGRVYWEKFVPELSLDVFIHSPFIHSSFSYQFKATKQHFPLRETVYKNSSKCLSSPGSFSIGDYYRWICKI